MLHTISILPRGRRALVPVALLGSGLALTACGGGDGAVGFDSTRIDLDEVNDSGMSGEVMLLSAGQDEVLVAVVLGSEDEPEGELPAAIFAGECEGLAGERLHDLGRMEGGVLVRRINDSIDSLRDEGHSLVVFQSPDESVFVACADL